MVILGSLLIKLGILCMNIRSSCLVKISVGENFCQRKKTIAKISVGKSKVTEIFATEIFAPKVVN